MGKRKRRQPADGMRAAIRHIWESIPNANCKGLCSNSCRGPAPMSIAEWNIIHERGFDIPHPGSGARWKEARDDPAYECPALVSGRCAVYDIRPTVCRLWGAVEHLPCPYGCEPSGGLWPSWRAWEAYFRAALVGGDFQLTRDQLAKLLREIRTPAGKTATKEWSRVLAVQSLNVWTRLYRKGASRQVSFCSTATGEGDRRGEGNLDDPAGN